MLFKYKNQSCYSCSSDGRMKGVCDEKDGPYEPLKSVKRNVPLGKLVVEKNWRSIVELIYALVEKKQLKILVHPCITKEAFWKSTGEPEMQDSIYNVNVGVFSMIPRLELIVVRAIQTMYELRDKGSTSNEHGHFDNFKHERITNKKVEMTFSGKRITVGLIEQEDGTGSSLCVVVHD